jgi:hypothetical protein
MDMGEGQEIEGEEIRGEEIPDELPNSGTTYIRDA